MRKAIIKDNCKACKDFWELEVDEEGIEAWRSKKKTLKQAFPYLSKDEREVLSSGLCLRCVAKQRKAEKK